MRTLRALALATVAMLPLASVAPAQEKTAAVEQKQASSREEFERVSREVMLSADRLAQLAAEIDGVRKDHATITASLIQVAKTEKKLAEDVEEITNRLGELRGQEDAIRQSLMSRRDVLAEVLGALQRMGLNPPPAILVTPEDALSSVRSAILLGAVVPGLKEETEILIADLGELSRVSSAIEADRGRLLATVDQQLAEKQRLNLLLGEKKALQAESEAIYEEERRKSAELASKAGTLKDLIGSLDSELAALRSAEEKQRRAEEARIRREAALRQMPVPEQNRLAAAGPFATLRGQLSLPVPGRISRGFGERDDNGGVMQGDTVATQSAAIVTAPSDGTVLYAGPFRSYGQLLILDAGGGYHVVLSGMGRISVAAGQSVLAGEPVGVMGEIRVASAASAEDGNGGSELYIEFRQDGKPVDPAPWWAGRLSGRTRNGT